MNKKYYNETVLISLRSCRAVLMDLLQSDMSKQVVSSLNKYGVDLAIVYQILNFPDDFGKESCKCHPHDAAYYGCQCNKED